MTEGKNVAIVLAAGLGRRMHAKRAKQFLHINGKPMLAHTLLAFEHCDLIDEIILVVGEQEEELCRKEVLEPESFRKISRIVTGGAERYDSSRNGLLAVKDATYVLIHDGARPCVDDGVIARALEQAKIGGASVAAVPEKDTIRRAVSAGEPAGEVLDRQEIWRVQTPQVFSYPLIMEAFRAYYADENRRPVTDDASVVETMTGHAILIAEGSYCNLKVTTPEDLLLAEAILKKN